MKKCPVNQFYGSLGFCVLLLLFVSSVAADVLLPETSALSPLKKEVMEERIDLRSMGSYDDESGQIIDLEPLVISPIVTTTEQLIEDMRRNPDQFLTGKGWRENMGYRSEFDEFLNLFSLPLFALPQEAIAFMYAQDAKLEKKLETFERIMHARKLYRKSSTDAYMQDRYDLMRMKRNALFGSSWALPEIGK